jgi:hypothetical protein
MGRSFFCFWSWILIFDSENLVYSLVSFPLLVVSLILLIYAFNFGVSSSIISAGMSICSSFSWFRVRAKSRPMAVSYNDRQALRTKLWLPTEVPRPLVFAMLAANSLADIITCFQTLSCAMRFHDKSIFQISPASFSASL